MEKLTGIKDRLSNAQKLWIGLAVVFLLLLALSFLLYFLKAQLFEENNHFTLKELRICRPDGFSQSFWNGEKNREKRLRELRIELSILEGSTNLFTLEPARIREQLLKNHPEIRRVNVRRILPDQLEFEIYERLPIVNIGPEIGSTVRIDRYLDEEGYVISSDRCEPVVLPRVIDMSDREVGKAKCGDMIRTDGIKLTLSFVGLIARSYPQLNVRVIKLDTLQSCIQSEVQYAGNIYTVLLPYPVSEDKLQNDIMGRLLPALKQQHLRRDFTSFIDLRFENQTVVRPRTAK